MKKQNPISITAACLAAVVLALAGGSAQAGSDDKFIAGDWVAVGGGTVSTWARVNGAGKVIWVGLTIPLSMAENMPPPGSGPAGAVATLNYPAVVQQTTYFNHAEIQSNEHGHPANPRFADVHRYEAPHFDFHFYSIPVAQVLNSLRASISAAAERIGRSLAGGICTAGILGSADGPARVTAQ